MGMAQWYSDMRVHGPGMAGSDMRVYMGMAGNLLKAMGGITMSFGIKAHSKLYR